MTGENLCKATWEESFGAKTMRRAVAFRESVKLLGAGWFEQPRCRFKYPRGPRSRPSRAFSLVNTKATAMRVLSLSGKPLVSWSGPAVSTLIRKVFGLRRYRPGRFVREAAMTSMGSLAGTRRCISPHVFAAVGRLLSALRPMAPSMPSHMNREKGVGAEACPRS